MRTIETRVGLSRFIKYYKKTSFYGERKIETCEHVRLSRNDKKRTIYVHHNLHIL
jgi:hypothetical protein